MPGLIHSIRLLRPIRTVRRSKLLGDVQSGVAVQRTDDTTPELVFNWQGAPPATVTLINSGTGVSYGPFAVSGGGASITSELPPGIYTVGSQALNGNGELDRITGSLEIVALGPMYMGNSFAYIGSDGIAYHFVDSVPTSFSNGFNGGFGI